MPLARRLTPVILPSKLTISVIRHRVCLYGNQSNVYNAVQEWLRAGGDTRNMRQFGIDARQMEGADNYGNVQFTGYYTPVIQARHTRRASSSIPFTVCRQNVVVCRLVRRSTQGH